MDNLNGVLKRLVCTILLETLNEKIMLCYNSDNTHWDRRYPY
jgi:hypothetical protein